MEYTFSEAEKAIIKCGSRDPYELLDSIGAVVKFSYEFMPGGLKGFSTILNHTMYAVVNGNLDEHERRIVAGHEAAHLILHKKEILLSPANTMRDFSLWGSSGKLEHQANRFLADFLVSDKEVMDIVSNEDHDYFAAANQLCLPPPLLAFKLYSMIQRGFNLRNPADLRSGFLASGRIR
ncbi:MAG: ImmA/IrrE family metallo-endopeptidase [Defluviitaleaceae bacterium]|nr:ImmA/IrrE family metallo-endopeptidase [Defluviitaleaceae bacterium]